MGRVMTESEGNVIFKLALHYVREFCNTKARRGHEHGGRDHISFRRTHFIKYVVSMPALPLTIVCVGKPLGSGKQVTRSSKEVKDERAPWGVAPEIYAGTELLRCGF